MPYTAKQIERFWRKVDKQKSNIFCNGSRCWEWTASRNQDSYGKVTLGKKQYYVHRVSYEITLGSVPGGLEVLHRCDNPPCVNPAHLFLGTHKDNMGDKVLKGRQSKLHGESHGSCKLSDKQVDEIRRRYAWQGIGGDSSGTLAREFGVSDVQILAIVHRKLRK